MGARSHAWSALHDAMTSGDDDRIGIAILEVERTITHDVLTDLEHRLASFVDTMSPVRAAWWHREIAQLYADRG
jgi:hypothetical protein